MGKYIKISFIILLTTITNFSAKANEVNKPDFAFPQKVSQQAETNLNNALKTGNGNAIIRSLIDFSIAQTLINSDSIQPIINKIEQVVAKEKNQRKNVTITTVFN